MGVGEAVGVWGVGGVGTHIVQLADGSVRHRSSPSTSTTAVRDRALELRCRLRVRLPRPGVEEHIGEITAGRKLDVASDAVGLKVTFEQALFDRLAVGGRLMGVG